MLTCAVTAHPHLHASGPGHRSPRNDRAEQGGEETSWQLESREMKAKRAYDSVDWVKAGLLPNNRVEKGHLFNKENKSNTLDNKEKS